MYLLDTNVVSEVRKIRAGKADPRVAEWADTVDAGSLYLSVITVLELDIGVLQLERRDPHGGAVLRRWLETLLLPEFAGRILPICTTVVRRRARLHVPDPRSERNALIAATALTHGMTVVTRNISDFPGPEVQTLNPWDAV